MQGRGVPRYENHIKLMQEYLDEFQAHHEMISQFGRDPKRSFIMEREVKPEEEEFL